MQNKSTLRLLFSGFFLNLIIYFVRVASSVCNRLHRRTQTGMLTGEIGSGRDLQGRFQLWSHTIGQNVIPMTSLAIKSYRRNALCLETAKEKEIVSFILLGLQLLNADGLCKIESGV